MHSVLRGKRWCKRVSDDQHGLDTSERLCVCTRDAFASTYVVVFPASTCAMIPMLRTSDNAADVHAASGMGEG